MDNQPVIQPANNASLLIRLPTEMKADLARAAAINGKKMNTEVIDRLAASLAASVTNPNPYARPNTPTVALTNDHGPAGALADTDRAMLEVFRKLPVEKQLALLSLFR